MPIPFLFGLALGAGSLAGAATAATVATTVATVAVAVLAGIGINALIKAQFNKANKDDPADLTILLLGEQAAGKDTIMRSLQDKPFSSEHIATVHHYDTILSNVKGKKIKVINTSGSESTLEDAEIARNLQHNIRCYVFDAREFYKNKKIKLGIKNSINECKEKNISLITIGTRGAEISDIKKIENEVRSMGTYCKIFEFKNNPREDLITYIFGEYTK